MPMKRKVVRSYETKKLTPTRELETWVIVEFMLDDFGPLSFEAPKKDFSWDQVKAAMDKEEKGLSSIS